MNTKLTLLVIFYFLLGSYNAQTLTPEKPGYVIDHTKIIGIGTINTIYSPGIVFSEKSKEHANAYLNTFQEITSFEVRNDAVEINWNTVTNKSVILFYEKLIIELISKNTTD